jgi:hypothetical protein
MTKINGFGSIKPAFAMPAGTKTNPAADNPHSASVFGHNKEIHGHHHKGFKDFKAGEKPKLAEPPKLGTKPAKPEPPPIKQENPFAVTKSEPPSNTTKPIEIPSSPKPQETTTTNTVNPFSPEIPKEAQPE